MSDSPKLRLVLWFALLLAAIVLAFGVVGHARPRPAQNANKPFVIEYYYKAKWGHADEFITLFRKNHYPLLKKQVEMGRLLNVSAVAPVYHTTEDGRWDYRVTIVYKNAAMANDGFDSASDQAALSRSGDVQEGRATPLRNPGSSLGFPVKEVDLN